jgi:hypothetical protein
VSGVRLAASLPLQRRTWIRMLGPPMPYVSFSANSMPNIPGLLMLVQILWTRTLNVYFLSHKYQIEDLEYSRLQSPNIPDHIDEYLFLLKEIFR